MRKVVLLTNFIPPYRLSVLRAIAAGLEDFRVWISTPMEANRKWAVDYGDLDVRVQKTVTVRGWWRHPAGFAERSNIHFPYDTLSRLWRVRPDVVVSVEMGFRTLLAALYRRCTNRTQLVVWADISSVTEEGRGFVRMALRRWILRAADAVVVNGESGAHYIREQGIADEQIHRIPYTTDVDAFTATPLTRSEEAAHRLLYCGQMIARKGLIRFLEVLREWAGYHPDRRVEFCLVGDGALKAQLEDFAVPGNLTLRFEPQKSYADLPAIYGDAGIFVLPTLADTWGLVVNEAMASGLPVLGSIYSQAVEELVEPGKTGWLFRPDQKAEIYAALDSALNTSREALDEMRRAARLKAGAVTPDKVARQVLDLLRALDARRQRRRVAILTNIVAPYKAPIYDILAQTFETTVMVGGAEDNRSHWGNRGRIGSFQVVRCWGVSIRWVHKTAGRVFDVRYLHLTLGYLTKLLGLRPEAIVSNEMGFRTLVAVTYGALARVPVWVWWGGTRETEKNRGLTRRLLRAYLTKRVQHWISYGKTSTAYLRGIGIKPERILQVQNSVDHRAFAAAAGGRQMDTGGPRLLYVGQMLLCKGVHLLLESAARLQAEGEVFSLLLVGGGPEDSRFRGLAVRLGLRNVKFLKSQPPDKMASIYSQSDCLILPTLEEVWGLVVNEALWAGLPVACSRFAGCAEELLPASNVFDPTKPDEFDRMLRSSVRGTLAPANAAVLKTHEDVGSAIIADIERVLEGKPLETASALVS